MSEANPFLLYVKQTPMQYRTLDLNVKHHFTRKSVLLETLSGAYKFKILFFTVLAQLYSYIFHFLFCQFEAKNIFAQVISGFWQKLFQILLEIHFRFY